MPFDYIIVGAGSAGCLLANRLSANPNHRVLLLEAGSEDKDKAIHIPVAFSKLFRSQYDWGDDSVPQAAMNNRRLYQPRGKVLGGSSSINAMIYIRGHRADYDHWAALGNEGWSYKDVLPYFRRFEQNLEFDDDYHGTQGELTVSRGRHNHLLSKQLLRAAEQAGYPLNEDFNSAQQEGFGWYQVTQRGGKRCSASRAFLEPVRHRSNLEVHTQAFAHRILMEGKKAVGVLYKRGRELVKAKARREVILCAGSFNSPHLLMLSGIGDRATLRKHGVDVVHHLPGVGQNLQDHLLVGCVYHTPLKNTLDSAERFPWAIKYLLQFLLRKQGLLTSNIAECGGFLRSLPNQAAPDLQWHFSPGYFLRHGFDNPKTGNGAGLGMTLICPHSRGNVQLQSPDPEDRPLIDPNYLSDTRDIATFIRGYRITERIMAQPVLKPYLKKRFMPPPGVETKPAVIDYIREWAQSLYHPVGTCKMGQGDAAVVDNQLAVYGVDNLRVVDASIMPVIVRGNTNAPAMMIAEKAAELIQHPPDI
jgi:choline dehydrogenase